MGAKKYLLVSIDHFTAWPEAKVLQIPITEKGFEFLKKYIAQHGIPQKNKNGPGNNFSLQILKEFSRKMYIENIECPPNKGS